MLLNYMWGLSRWSWLGLEAGGKGRLGYEPIAWEQATDFLFQAGSQLCVENMSLSFRKASLGLQPGPWALTGSMSKTKPTKGSETNVSKKEIKHFSGDTLALCLPGSYKNPPGCPPKFSSLSLKQWTSLKERIEATVRMGWTNQEEAQWQA